MNDKIQMFCDIIETHNNIVFFGGAGVSTEIVPKTLKILYTKSLIYRAFFVECQN